MSSSHITWGTRGFIIKKKYFLSFLVGMQFGLKILKVVFSGKTLTKTTKSCTGMNAYQM